MEPLEPEIERILARFRIPPDEAHEILDEVMLTLLTKRARIKNPQRWLARSLKSRCVLYWQERRRLVYRVVDSGIRSVLEAHETPEAEGEMLRRRLRSAIETIRPCCREVLSRRYGLDAAGGEPVLAPECEVYRCVGALVRRMLARVDLAEDPEEELDELEALEGFEDLDDEWSGEGDEG